MLRIDPRLVGAMIGLMLSGFVWGKTDPECLRHLGGGYADAECYSGLRQEVEAQNQQLYTRIRGQIPAGNSHLALLDSYMRAQDEALKFCELQRDSSAKWNSDPDGSMYPALYEQCAYEHRKIQNKFLTDLLMMEQE
ncbi:hypothetical protein [Paraburkholderia bannensis]|uniref:hypothetical protein n=1 Tax=Paraburkholderia bannensis TaxID=765414 RepID=UPI002AB68246|nr:hypothetical protein [Paraburkholderia bannensis]